MSFLQNTIDRAKALFDVRLVRRAELEDYMRWQPQWNIKRFANKSDHKHNIIYEPKEAEELFDGMPQINVVQGNLLTKNGLLDIWKLIATSGGVQYNNANANIGVGTGSPTCAKGDTALSANPVYKGMDSGYPAISGANNDTGTFQSTFGSGDANQVWGEFGLFTDASGSNMLNHLTNAQGTKTLGQVWQIQLVSVFS